MKSIYSLKQLSDEVESLDVDDLFMLFQIIIGRFCKIAKEKFKEVGEEMPVLTNDSGNEISIPCRRCLLGSYVCRTITDRVNCCFGTTLPDDESDEEENDE